MSEDCSLISDCKWLEEEPWDLLGDCYNFADSETDPRRSHWGV